MQSSIPYRSGLIHIESFQPVQISGRIPRFDADASKPRFIGSRRLDKLFCSKDEAEIASAQMR